MVIFTREIFLGFVRISQQVRQFWKGYQISEIFVKISHKNTTSGSG
jgi:hypothetical protein